MQIQTKSKTILLMLLFLSILSHSTCLEAAEFDAMVVPSLMDSAMDGWYRIPPNSGPEIHKASTVFQGQMFNLLIFFKGYSADNNNNLHVRYDVQVFDPEGNPTEDKGANLLAYQGPMGNPKALMLNQQYLKMIFTDEYPLGTYKIKVTAHDMNSGNSFTSETPIDLLPFTFDGKFKSKDEAEQWMMKYYTSPTPIKAISGVQTLVQLEGNWLKENKNTLIFFRRIFSDNPFLLKNIAKKLYSFSPDDQMKFTLISAISGDKSLEPMFNIAGKEDLKDFYITAQKMPIPDVTGEINTATQLDILWSEFLATGKYEPIRKIVSALALNKHRGILKKIKSGEIEMTKEVEKQAYLEATYQSALWSLISNCKQMPLVFKYCVTMYQYESLDKEIKGQLGAILRKVQREKEAGKSQ